MSASQSSKKRKTWDEEKMAEAIKIVREKKIGYLKAAQQNAIRDGCTTNIATLESRSETDRALTEISVPDPDANIQTEHEPSTSGLNRSNLGLVSPYAISPVPEKRRKVSNRGRKPFVAAVITSSPYKNDLVNKNIKSQEKENKLAKTKNKKKTAKRNKRTKKNKTDCEEDSEEQDFCQLDEDSGPDELMGQVFPTSADAECMFCQILLSTDNNGESWIKCIMCGLWAYYDCAGPEFDTWICDFCK